MVEAVGEWRRGMGDVATDYLSQAAYSFQAATDGKDAVVMGRGDTAQAAQIAALLAIAQRLDAILEVLRTQSR
jgi:hypothetical protein